MHFIHDVSIFLKRVKISKETTISFKHMIKLMTQSFDWPNPILLISNRVSNFSNYDEVFLNETRNFKLYQDQNVSNCVNVF